MELTFKREIRVAGATRPEGSCAAPRRAKCPSRQARLRHFPLRQQSEGIDMERQRPQLRPPSKLNHALAPSLADQHGRKRCMLQISAIETSGRSFLSPPDLFPTFGIVDLHVFVITRRSALRFFTQNSEWYPKTLGGLSRRPAKPSFRRQPKLAEASWSARAL